uniref:Elongation of very long chain fatty acids protein n=1 Tax=Panagrolaimus superbus TaxID=310955 RepID=A0A914Z3Z7_9BILA
MLNFDQKAIKENLTTLKFDGEKFWQIFTNPNFPEDDARSWVNEHFYLTIQVSILYVLVIFGTKFFMRNREPFQLTLPLNIWNFFLSSFSILGTWKLSSDYFQTIANYGIVNSFCRNYNFTNGTTGFWAWLFVISKLIELVDTVFLVLRKRPLLFLHWYHHILTMIYIFYSYPFAPGFNRWGIYMNYVVHSFMYSYYLIRSMKIKVPGFIAKLITTLQLIQFIISVICIAYLAVIIHYQGYQCDFEPKVFSLAIFMDFTYLLLFINFFYQSYVKRGGKSKYQNKEGKKQK